MRKKFTGEFYDFDYFVKTDRATAFSDRGKRMSVQRWHMLEPFLQEREKIDKNVNILELGCANGYFLSLFQNRNVDLYGIDISQFCMDEAHKNVNAKLSVLDVDENPFPFRDETFDIIAAFTVLEHLYNYENVIQEFNRISKNGGYVYIMCPVIPLIFFNRSLNYFIYHSAQKILKWFGKSFLTVPTHVSILHKQEWFSLFHKHGFTIKKNFTAEGFIAPLFDRVPDAVRRPMLTFFPEWALTFHVIMKKETPNSSRVPRLETIEHYKRI